MKLFSGGSDAGVTTGYKVAALAMMVLLAAGCGRARPATPAVTAAQTTPTSVPATLTAVPGPTSTATPTVTASSTATPTATPTPTPTPTPTATPTPTPTALPLTVSGDPRQAVLHAPQPQSAAPCGIVDSFDFPLSPPDGWPGASGGRDFGVYRSRYNGYHTGEDWWAGSRSTTLGAPVYSIAHGMVTYAQPLGWGADQGVVILRHVLPDGTAILSMYGHLDPSSVNLHPGDCVARGDPLGQIGKPRSPPHLHFEIRQRLPGSPGPGYWSDDPTQAGWIAPSQYIWNYRIAVSPGVRWARPLATPGTHGLGPLGPDTFAIIEDEHLVGIDLLDGGPRWQAGLPDNLVDAVLSADGSALYVADLFGRVTAFTTATLPDGAEAGTREISLQPRWEIELDTIGAVALLPLPGGGVVASSRRQMFAISPAGELLWQQDAATAVFDWALAGDDLIVSAVGREGSLWTLNTSGAQQWTAAASGRPVAVGDEIWLYAADGVYRLDRERRSTELLYALPQGALWWGDMIPLPGGNVLVAHTDRFDRRLILLNGEGRLRWERSFAGITEGEQQLLSSNGRVYLISQDSGVSSGELAIFRIDMGQAELTRVFQGGSRNPQPQESWVVETGDNHLLVHIGGGSLALLDPQAATDVLSQTTRTTQTP